MTLQQLKYILAVEQYLSFNLAAEACRVAQPSLSAQVKKLEEELGVVIFDRSTSSGVKVTEVGQAVLLRARRVLAEVQQLEDESGSFQNEIRGTLKLGLIPTVSPFLVPHFMGPLIKEHPQLKIEIIEDRTENLVQELHQGRIDAAILSTPKKAPESLIEKALFYEPFMVYASVGHALLQTNSLKLSQISEHAVTLLDETHCMRDQVVAACGKNMTEKQGSSVQLVSGGLQTLISIVEKNQSFTLIPKLAEPILHFQHKKGGLRDIASPTPFRKISLLYHKAFARKRLLDTLQKVIQESLPETVSLKSPPRSVVLDPSLKHF